MAWGGVGTAGESHTAFAECLDSRGKRLDQGRAAWIAERIPREWDVPPDHREALSRFLHGRAAALPRILFTNWPRD